MAIPAKTFKEGTRYLEGVKKGDRVRLLLPIYDGVERISEGEVIMWPYDDPPTLEVACHVDQKQTPLTAPAFTDGKPPPGYVDPRTGEPPFVATPGSG